MLKWIEFLVDVANPIRNEEVKKYTASAAFNGQYWEEVATRRERSKIDILE